MVFLLPEASRFELPEVIQENLQEFVDTIKDNLPTPAIFKSNGFAESDMSKIFELLKAIFNLK